MLLDISLWREFWWAAVVAGFAGRVAAQEKITFADHVLPLVEQHCAKCHNPDKKKGDLDLTSYSGALKGGGSGVVVVSGNVDSSKLIKSITHAEEPTMPPNKPPLPDKELAVFKKYYVHRIGRTGRAGASGISISLISEDDAFNLPALEEFLGHPVVCTQPEL